MSVKTRICTAQKQLGFTVLELMIAVVIAGVMAAIALPSYRHHLVKNAELEAQTQMGSLQMEMERWRTTAMSYRGFFPSKGGSEFGYDEDESVVYVPRGSGNSNYRYKIEILEGTSTDSTKKVLAHEPADTEAEDPDMTVGRSWVMRATPNPNHTIVGDNRGRSFLSHSNGLKCATTHGTDPSILTLDISASACSGNLETWR